MMGMPNWFDEPAGGVRAGGCGPLHIELDRFTRARPAAFLLLVPLLTVAGCGDDSPTTSEPEPEPDPEPTPARIDIAPAETVLQVEDTIRFRATVVGSDGNEISDVSVSWRSSDTTVLSITDDGLARGLDGGLADVTASLEDLEARAEAKVQLPLGGAPGLDGNIFYGYQGWFGCPGDGGGMGWLHWFFGQTPTAENLTVDMWPDVSELDDDELCRTDMTLPDGSPAYAFSSHNRKTVMRHFRWMEEYGVDGAVLHLLPPDIPAVEAKRERDVLEYARDAAEIYGRRFFISYRGVSSVDGVFNVISEDWAAIVDESGLTDSPAYVKVNGRPVVSLWGFGFDEPWADASSPEEAMALIRWLQEEAPPRMRATVLGGVPAYWRTLDRDSRGGESWAEVYRSFDIISPWAVGRFDGEAYTADDFLREVVGPDLEEARANGIRYMPVAWPGFSFHNLYDDAPFNEIPRNGGRLFWRQIYNLVSADVSTIYVAMFDEVDEGTAMFKVAPTEDQAPVGAPFVTLDIDGHDLPSDWYLQLGREAGRMLRGEIPLSPEMPITPTSSPAGGGR